MEFEDMNQRASLLEKAPDDLTPAERTIYQALVLTYLLYRQKWISWEEGVEIKNGLARDFEQYRKMEAEWMRCQTVMKMLRRCDLPSVRGIVEQADRMFREDDVLPWH